MKETRVNDLVDLLFFAGRELDGWWRRRVPIEDSTKMMRFKKGYMKDIMNIEVRWGSSKQTAMGPIFSMKKRGPNFL
jgi:hypothetical protein